MMDQQERRQLEFSFTPTIYEYADRIIALEERLDACRDHQTYLMCEIGRIHWRGGWTGKDGRRLPNPMERFMSIVEFDDETGCWNWPMHRVSNSGYGLFGFDGGIVLAHRFSAQFTKGLRGLPFVVDHLCSNPRCVNPSHLEEVTQSENVKRGIARAGPKERATHCKRGHPFDDNNTFRLTGARWCRTCATATKLRWQRANRDKK
jgi:hypothetical protein